MGAAKHSRLRREAPSQQRLRCDVQLARVCLAKAPRTGFRVFARYVKVCPACWTKLEPYVYALEEVERQILELIIRRIATLLNERAETQGPFQTPAAIAAQMEREFLPRLYDDEPPARRLRIAA